MNKPNILLISIDTLRADHLSCYGYHRQTTPNIDRLAAEGVLFKNAYSTAVWTPPAHASMLTGLYPSQHGVVANKRLKQDIPTIAEVLAQYDYNTVGFVNNPQVGAFVGLDKGFHQFFEIWKGVTSKNLLVRGCHFLYRNWLALLGIQDDGAKKTNKLVVNWLKSHISDTRPFYIFLHYIEPHNPINAPHPFKKKYVDSKHIDNIGKKKLKKVANNPLVCFTDRLNLNQAEINYLISLYDGEIAYIDTMVGEVIDFLKAKNVLDDTFVILTADHGEHLGEHSLYSHVASLYEPIVHIPLIIRYLRIYKPSQRYEQLVQHIDIFPTILDLLNNNENHLINLAGQSLLPRNGKITIDKKRPIIAEWEGRIPHFVKNRLKVLNKPQDKEAVFLKKLSMIRESNEKYIYCDDGSEELFNLDSDPNEINNLASTNKQRCTNLRDILTRTLKAESSNEEIPETEMDEVVKQRLHGLGYL